MKDTILKLHAHFKWIASGDFTERDFEFTLPGKNKGDVAGKSSMGDINAKRKQLMQEDAERHLDALETKFPELTQEPKKEVKKAKV